MRASAASPKLDRRALRRVVWIVVAFALVISFVGLFQHHLWTPDEPREAEIGREMADSGLSAVPRLNGEPFLEKPPLFVWCMAAAYRSFGVSDGVARLPSAIFAVGSLLVAYALGRRAGGRLAGLCSALVLGTTAKFADIGHSAVNDNALVFFVAAGHLAILVARDRSRSSGAQSAWLVAGLCAGLAFLTKSFIGPVLIAGPTLLAFVFLGEWRLARQAFVRLACVCTAGVLVLGVPWVLALAHEAGWEAVKTCLFANTIGRAFGELAGPQDFATHAHGPFEYLKAFPLEFLPWTLALPALISSTALSREHRGARARFLALTAFAGLLLLSIPAGKRGLYALPLYPAASAAVGVWLARTSDVASRRIDRATFALIVGVCLTVCIALALAGGLTITGPLVNARPELALLRDQEHAALIAAALVFLVGGSFIALNAFARRMEGRVLALFAVVSVFVLAQSSLRPLVDRFKSMHRGVAELERVAPDPAHMLGYNWDETTNAVVPFYLGRLVPTVRRGSDALERLKNGSASCLISQDEPSHAPEPALAAHLRVQSRVVLSSTRALLVQVLDRSR